MKRLALLITAGLLVAALIPIQLHAGWVKTYGKEFRRDWGTYVQQTPDGGYIVSGFTSSFNAAFAEDVWLLKTDSEGDTLWTRTYGGEKRDQAYCVQQTSDGGYILVGMTQSFARLGDQDLWLLKTDSEGDTLWTRIYGGDGGESDMEAGNFVQETPDGGYIVLGSQANTYNPCTSFWLLKTDEAGDTLWTRTYDLTGKKGWNWGTCIRQTTDGGYILTGASDHPDTMKDALTLVKTDANGDTLWMRLYEGKEKMGCGTCVQLTPDGGYIISGYKEIPEPPDHWVPFEYWLLKTDEKGNTLWTRTYRHAKSNHANCVDQTTDGGYILVGYAGGSAPYTQSDIWLVKTDASGDTLWTRTFGKKNNTNSGMCVHQTSDRGYIITGYTGLMGVDDLYLIKTDSLGHTSVAEEPPVTPVTHPSNWQISASIGPQITLRYTNYSQGFHAQVFNALGCKVDELHSNKESGTITWPTTPVTPATHHTPGVYFIRVESNNSGSAHKIVLIK